MQRLAGNKNGRNIQFRPFAMPLFSNLGSLGIAVIHLHIWWHGVSRIANPTYIWRRITANPREPQFIDSPYAKQEFATEFAEKTSKKNSVRSVARLRKVLLIFTLASYEGVAPWTANANIGSITTCDLIVPAAADDAVIFAKSVNCICAGTAQDQVSVFSSSD
jgi:hypothetical protein